MLYSYATGIDEGHRKRVKIYNYEELKTSSRCVVFGSYDRATVIGCVCILWCRRFGKKTSADFIENVR